MKRIAVLALALFVAAGIAWLSLRQDALRLQWDCYQVTRADTYTKFRRQVQEFEKGGSDARLAALAARWHTGNRRFDEHLVRYINDPQCSESLRRAFSLELSARRELLPAWSGAWQRQHPDWQERAASLKRYLEILHPIEPARELTWQDVLEMQAVLVQEGRAQLAHRLAPDNWRGRYQRWQAGENENQR